MIKKLVPSFLLLCLCVVTSLNAKTIIWVTEAQDQDGDGVNDSKVWADKLTAAGYTVDFQPGNWNTFTDTLLAQVNAADLVIVSCTTQSSTFTTDTAETARWNSVTAPMMLCSPYIARSTRWQWINNGDGTLPNNNGDQGSPLMQVTKADHPIFYGVTLDVSNQLKALDPNLGSGNATFLASNNPGNGILLAKTVPTSLVQDWSWIIEWKKGTKFYTGSTYSATNNRMYFTGIGYHEVSGSKPMRGYSLTDQGWKLFLNAVKYMLGERLTPPTLASDPHPLDGQTDVLATAALSWTPGAGTPMHDVYLGTSFADVNSAGRASPLGVLAKQNGDVNNFDPPGKLAYGTTYYWRVDEVTGSTAKGWVWSFTTEPLYYTVTDIVATASSFTAGSGPEQTVNGSGLDANDLHSATNTTMWLTAKGATLPAWIQYDLGRVRKVEKMIVWNYNGPFEDAVGVGAKDVTVEYSTDAVSWTQLSGVPQFAWGPGADGYAADTTVDFAGVAARFVKLTITGSWGTTTQTGLSEVRFLQTIDYARTPFPADKATGVSPSVTLGWRAGREAASHSIYVGTDANTLTLSGSSAINSFAPANLSLGTTYYWRVDEVNTALTPTTWASDVWSFSTPDFITVDDMESYNDTTNKLYEVWIDGYNTGTNGAIVGYNDSGSTGTFGDIVTFHGGKQSMPYAYGTGGIALSEATRTFDATQDWTTAGIQTLVLYFRGVTTNNPAQLYLKINGTKVNYTGSSAGLAVAMWKEWNIDLASVSGVNLKAVKSLTIGVTGSGAKGTLYFDDILLYKTAPAVAVPVDPGTTGLVSYFNMDSGKVADTISGVTGVLTDVTFAASKDTGLGQAAVFNGSSSYVDLGLDYWTKVLSKLSSSTFSVWVNYTGLGSTWPRVLALGTGVNANVLMIPSAATAGIVRFQVKTNVPNAGLPDAGYVTAYVESSKAISVGWHHLVGVVDDSRASFAYPVLYLYVDGARAGGPVAGKLPKDIDVVTGTAPQMWLGRSHNTADPFFNGSIDELKVFNRALTAGEIAYIAGDR